MTPRLLAITPPAGSVDPAIVNAWRAAGALELGFFVLLREPGTPPERVIAGDHRLARLRDACAAAGIPTLLSCAVDDLPRGAAVVASGQCHGLQLRGDPEEPTLEQARAALGSAVLGRSCHGGPAPGHPWVDYSCLAPIFAPQTQQGTYVKRPIGVPALRRFATDPAARVVALGGVNGQTAQRCLEAGAIGLAGIATFFGEPAQVQQDVAAMVGTCRTWSPPHVSTP